MDNWMTVEEAKAYLIKVGNSGKVDNEIKLNIALNIVEEWAQAELDKHKQNRRDQIIAAYIVLILVVIGVMAYIVASMIRG
jgi:hypothetical protein